MTRVFHIPSTEEDAIINAGIDGDPDTRELTDADLSAAVRADGTPLDPAGYARKQLMDLIATLDGLDDANRAAIEPTLVKVRDALESLG